MREVVCKEINRSDLEERFGVSTPQASADLRSYQEAAPNNIEYDATEKAYVPTPQFQPKFLRVSADRYLIQLDAILNGAIPAVDTWFGSPVPAAVMPTVARSVDAETLRILLRSITWRREVEIEYQSLTSTRRRAIVPHSLAFDGHRWHVRAWCVERLSFRDFVLSRILSVGESRTNAEGAFFLLLVHTGRICLFLAHVGCGRKVTLQADHRGVTQDHSQDARRHRFGASLP